MDIFGKYIINFQRVRYLENENEKLEAQMHEYEVTVTQVCYPSSYRYRYGLNNLLTAG